MSSERPAAKGTSGPCVAADCRVIIVKEDARSRRLNRSLSNNGERNLEPQTAVVRLEVLGDRSGIEAGLLDHH